MCGHFFFSLPLVKVIKREEKQISFFFSFEFFLWKKNFMQENATVGFIHIECVNKRKGQVTLFIPLQVFLHSVFYYQGNILYNEIKQSMKSIYFGWVYQKRKGKV